MNNTLKFLLTIALLMCAMFTVMLTTGCEENTKEVKCEMPYFYDKFLNKCSLHDCNEDKITPDPNAEIDTYSFCGCYNHHTIYCNKDAVNIIIVPRIELLTYTEQD